LLIKVYGVEIVNNKNKRLEEKLTYFKTNMKSEKSILLSRKTAVKKH